MADVRIHDDEFRGDWHLPPVCIVCGAAADEFDPVKRRFAWMPGWAYIFLLFIACGVIGIIIAMIVMGFARKSRSLRTPLCDDHRSYWAIRTWLNVTLLLSVFGTLVSIGVLASYDAPPWTFLLLIAAGFAFLVGGAVFQFRSVRATKVTDHFMILSNVSPEFRDAVVKERDWVNEERREWRRSRGIIYDDENQDLRPGGSERDGES
jgi:hypothetical protein